MSDFLVTFDVRFSGTALLEVLRLPYGCAVEGKSYDFDWGSVAILKDPISGKVNSEFSELGIFSYVGDLIARNSPPVGTELLAAATALRRQDPGTTQPATRAAALKDLNGAFAILLADTEGASVITDPLASVQVYAGRNRRGGIRAVGTHPDLVALLSSDQEEIDPVSTFEFINIGTPCFPHTMHFGVEELRPGRLHTFVSAPSGLITARDFEWWPFPDEFERLPDERTLAAQLEEAFAAAVQDRCEKGTVAVTLSGGLDSRLVMAAVPKSHRCIGFTFCDVINRESRIARRVARCYRREWVPLFRDPEYIARTALPTVRFTGCEGDWVNAHGMGFLEDLSRYEPQVVLSGLLMNNNVKGYYAADVARVARWRGLLPPRFEVVPYDYVNGLTSFRHGVFADGLLESCHARRKAFIAGHPGLKRQSVAEWLDGYPFSQASDNTAWVAERRLMPVRLPAMDRRLLDLACRIPMTAKASGQLFARMAKGVLGRGAWIPDANNGVRPGSNHVWRLVQRALRETANTRRNVLRSLGLNQAVPTSWHDYQAYWRQSGTLRQLLAEHGNHLDSFDGAVFVLNPAKLCSDPTLNWLHGFRLVQLALWKSVLQNYRSAVSAGRASKNRPELNAVKGGGR